MKYRNFTIGKTPHGFFCEQINCWACDTQAQVERAIDRYIDGDKDPQCRARQSEWLLLATEQLREHAKGVSRES